MWATIVFDFLSMLAYQAFTRKDQLCSKYLMDFQIQSSKHFQCLPPDQFQKCMNPKTKQKQNNKKVYESCCERFISKMAPLLVPAFCIIYLCCCYDLKINKQKQKKKKNPTTDKRGIRKEWSIFFSYSSRIQSIRYNWNKKLRQRATLWWQSVYKGNECPVSGHLLLLIQFSQHLQLKWVFPTQPTIKSPDEACPDARHLPTMKFRSHQDNNQY